MAQCCPEAARDYARERTAFGKAIIEHQAVAFRLADMATQIEAARQLVFHAATLRDKWSAVPFGSIDGQTLRVEMAERVCSDAIQIHGGYGYMADYPVERIYLDVRICQIYRERATCREW